VNPPHDEPIMNDPVAQIVERFDLKPHPEGGYFREVYRSALPVEHPGIPAPGERARRAGSFIYFLLGPGDFSAFHRVRWTDEIWHLYSGGPIELHLLSGDGRHSRQLLSNDMRLGEPTAVVPAGCWQAARLAPERKWGFGGCTVAPGFEFADFEMPRRAVLVEDYPAHAAIITELTRA
jgi:predicted cupin superfamily sugar epimerase